MDYKLKGLVSNTEVKVLGKKFKNDQERRVYFTEELRKKLPELKKMEGYPIGEDEDILNLSDPPYYTSCPNPWLNDFIKQWEEEKNFLELKGKRKAPFEVKIPYARDVSEGKNNPVYMVHSYCTKVPHPAIMRFILHYTQPGDIILDGFAGSGMTGVAANMCSDNEAVKSLNENNVKTGKRYCICSDLSTLATHISATYTAPFDVPALMEKANNIIDEAERELGWLYETQDSHFISGKIAYTVWSDVFICSNCSGEIVFFDAAVDLTNEKINDEFVCPHCGTKHNKKDLTKAKETILDRCLNQSIQRAKTVPVLIHYSLDKKNFERKPNSQDLETISKIDKLNIPYWFPMDNLPNGYNTAQPIKSHNYTNVYQFLTKRNLYIFSYLYEKMKEDTYLLSILTASFLNVSKMWKFKIDRKGGSLNGTLYIPSLSIEQNPFGVIRRKIKSFKALEYTACKDTLTSTVSATNLGIADNSIDYIFTDPPFGANIMYSELNFINESWLKVKTNEKEEAIENEVRHKTLFDYQNIMQRCFAEYYRVLKPGKWMTVEFSNTSASVWNSIQLGLNRVGFIIANVAALDKQQGSFKAVTTPTAVKQDLVISCYKPSETFSKNFKLQDTKTNVWSFIAEHIEHLPLPIIKEQSTTAVIERSPKILYDRVITYFLMSGLPVPIDAGDFQTGLRSRYHEADGMFFTAEQLHKYQELKKAYNNPRQLELFVSIIESESDAIQWLKDRLNNNPLKYQDIQPDYLRAYASNRKNEEKIELKVILEDNFIKNSDDTWRNPDLNEAKDREQLRTQALLRIFKDYCNDIDNGKKLKEVRLEALKAGFKDCYQKKDFERIVKVGNKIPENILTEDETLLNYYDIALNKQ